MEVGKRYYSRSGTSGVCVLDSRNVKHIKVVDGVTHEGREVATFLTIQDPDDWSETPCFKMDKGKLSDLAFEIDRAFLTAANLPCGRPLSAMSLRDKMAAEYSMPLDHDAVAGVKDFRVKLRETILSLNDGSSRV